MSSKGKVGIIGSGLIGRSWTMLFASVGYDVMLYDIESQQIQNAVKDIETQLKQLENSGLLRGTLDRHEQFKRIKTTTKLEECVSHAKYIQECIPEQLELKKALFSKIDTLVDDKTILASSSSCILPSKFTENLQHRSHALVVHPVNPPYYVPMVELVPAPWTCPKVVTQVEAIMKEIGQAPVVLKKEIDGFILNRIQYAILSEAWRLIENGVADVKDIDTVMSEGLGMRYAFLGPLETAHLNAEGMQEYADKYADGIHRVSAAFGPAPHMGKSEKLAEINKQLCDKVPLEKLQERRLWRDARVAALAKLKKEMGN